MAKKLFPKTLHLCSVKAVSHYFEKYDISNAFAIPVRSDFIVVALALLITIDSFFIFL